jgi:HlyD family secretion protein
MRTRSRLLIGAGVLVVAVLAFLGFRSRSGGAGYIALSVDRGEIADVVGATGTLQAVTTVQVGSQVSGTIASLGADFNSVVKKGQVIARLDPSLFQARVDQAAANLAAARAGVERSKATIDDAKQKYERAKALAAEGLVTQSDLDSAKATYDGAVAQNLADQAAVNQSGASLNQAKLDLQHSIIQAPIDGVVLARNVDVGQTVAASLQAPTLFVIANDLGRMEVNASVDEADIGRVRKDQEVTFRVDAFSGETFAGRVEQIRLQPVVNTNVVTYNTIITVDNSSLRLMPGMTATVSVVIDSRKDALRLPTTALRFRPAGYQEPPRPAALGSPAATGPRQNGGKAKGAESQAPGRSGMVFLLGDEGVPIPTKVRLGLSDGRYVEVLDGLAEGARVITGVATGGGAAAASGPAASSNPFQPARPQPRAR